MNFSFAGVADSCSCVLHMSVRTLPFLQTNQDVSVSSSCCRRSNEDHLLLPSPFGACSPDLEMVVVGIFLVVENCVAWSNTLG